MARLYDKNHWRKVRRAYRREHPLCERCLALGKKEPAVAVHHVIPHRNDITKFRLSPLQSLCAGCHDGVMQQIEKSGFSKEIGLDGYPVDPNHPFWKRKSK
jgi:5-methylcytosine-specific restriction endonuclease McrA